MNRLSRVTHMAIWMTSFEREVLRLNETFAGKIEWPSATHFFHSGLNPISAADRYVENRAVVTSEPR